MKIRFSFDGIFSIRFKIISFFYSAFLLLLFLGLITLQATQNVFQNQYEKSFKSDGVNILSLSEQPFLNSNFTLIDKILLSFYAKHQPYAILLLDDKYELIHNIGEYSPSLKLNPSSVFTDVRYQDKQLLPNGLLGYYFPLTKTIIHR